MDILDATFPPKPELTEANLPDQTGKVFIVTGSSTGIGLALATILYSKSAIVYLAARTESKTRAAMSAIQTAHPSSKGRLEFLPLDLADLSAVPAAASSFLSRETRLDVLWNNAGVMVPPRGSVTAQRYELQLGTNNLGPFLFTKLLYPMLVATAARADTKKKKGSVRVVWVASHGAQMAPRPAVDFENMNYVKEKEGKQGKGKGKGKSGGGEESQMVKYYRSKAGNVFHSVELARRSAEAGDGVVSVSLDPGLIKTDLGRTMPGWQTLLFRPFMSDTKYGAYTELFAGLSEKITYEEHNGAYVIPHGRLATEKCRADLRDPETTRRYWEWCEEQVKKYM